ncbi:MAG: hypothetical protein KJ048_01800 [Dehalococcoidia bacterium]|nr:hypothetical protein [Dehalococcoidia bacterium]
MTVSELMALLEDCDPEAEVRIIDQEGWPFECAIRGVVTRDMLGSDECDCDRRIGEPHDEECLAYGEDEDVYEDGLQANDVFIVEGRQERYGNKTAWQLVQQAIGGDTHRGARETGRSCVVRSAGAAPARRIECNAMMTNEDEPQAAATSRTRALVERLLLLRARVKTRHEVGFVWTILVGRFGTQRCSCCWQVSAPRR